MNKEPPWGRCPSTFYEIQCALMKGHKGLHCNVQDTVKWGGDVHATTTYANWFKTLRDRARGL